MKSYEQYCTQSLPWCRSFPEHWSLCRAKYMYKKESRPIREIDDVITCFRDGTVTLRKNRRTTGFTEAINETGYQGIRKGDLVIHVMDAFAGAIGVSDSDGKGTPVYSVCTPLGDYNNMYYALILREMAKKGFIQSLYRGIRERSSDFRFDVFAKQYLPVPPRDEQDQIVCFLDWKVSGINKLINIKKKEIKELDALKQSMISRAITHGLNPNVPIKFSGVKWFGYIPIHWKCKKVGALFQERKIKVSDKDYAPLSVAKIGIVPQLDTAVKTDAGDNRKLVCTGDFVINSRSDRKGSCGVSKLDGSVSLINIVLTPRRELNSDFVHYLMRSHAFSEEYYRNGRGIVADLWTTRYSEMKSILLPIPPCDEQDQIVSYLDEKVSMIDAAIASKRKQIRTLQDLKIVLISSAVTGQIDVRDIEILEYERIEEELDEDADVEPETEEIEERED